MGGAWGVGSTPSRRPVKGGRPYARGGPFHDGFFFVFAVDHPLDRRLTVNRRRLTANGY